MLVRHPLICDDEALEIYDLLWLCVIISKYCTELSRGTFPAAFFLESRFYILPDPQWRTSPIETGVWPSLSPFNELHSVQ